MIKPNTALENAQNQLKKSISLIEGLSENEKENLYIYLSTPNKVIKMNLKIKMDNGKIVNFIAFRSQHNNLKGPYKGGIRFHQNVSEDEVQALSIWMTIKTSIINLPLGGGKGGIIVNPKDLSKNEIEKLSREYVRQLYKNLGPDIDVPAPDVNTNGQIMSWMIDEYLKLTGKNDIGTFTGKPLDFGGSLGREEATGFGGIKVLETILNENNKKIKNKTFIIQGFGNVGQFAILKILEKGGIISGLSDSKGAIYLSDGFEKEDILFFIKDKNENGLSLQEISKTFLNNKKEIEYISNEQLLEKRCNVLIPAALENVITLENVEKIKSDMILELANGPIDFFADEILFKKNILVIPDVLANSGGVLVSYLEQVQNNMNFYWDKEDVLDKMNKLLEKETKSLISSKNSGFSANKNTLRDEVYKISIERLYKNAKIRGKI